MKKIISLCLIASMLFGCCFLFGACGGEIILDPDDMLHNNQKPNGQTKPVPDKPTPNEPTPDDPTPDGSTLDEQQFLNRMGKTDFNGIEINFIVCGGDDDMIVDTLNSRSIAPFDSQDRTFSVNAAVIDRNKKVEKALNVKINLKTVCAMLELDYSLRDSLFIGLHKYDIVSGYQYYDIGLAFMEGAGCFLNYETMDKNENYISLDQPYWDRNTYNKVMYKESAFWITGDLSQNWVGGAGVSYVNKTMWDDYADVIKKLPAANGISDLYEIVDKGLWTIDLVMQISNQIYEDLNHNDKIDRGDRVGYLSYQPSLNNIMTDILAAGSFVEYTSKSDRVPYMVFNNTRTGLFATKLVKLYTESKALLVSWDYEKYIVEMFAEGNVLMTPNYMRNAETDLAEMTDTYVILPPPLLMAGERYTTSVAENCAQFGIPFTTELEGKLAAATATLEAMAFYSYKDVTPVYYDLMLKGAYTAKDADSQKQAEIINLIRDSVYTDFALLWTINLDNVTWLFRQECTNKNILSKIQKAESDWSLKLDDLLEDLDAGYYIVM